MTGLLLFAVIGTPPATAPMPRTVEPDRAASRSMRWVLRFKIQDGKDYLGQLKLLDAKLMLQHPGDVNKSVLIPDLSKPETRREPTDDDLKVLSTQVKFSDIRKESVEGIAAELKIDFKPMKFWTFFPRALEEELARKEMDYRKRDWADIEQTIFRVIIRGEKVVIIVEDQTPLRKQ